MLPGEIPSAEVDGKKSPGILKFVPYVAIADPLAAMRLGPRDFFLSVFVAGKTDSSAPVSTKKERPEMISVTEIELELTAQIAGALIKPAAPSILHWLCRFPGWIDVETLHRVGH